MGEKAPDSALNKTWEHYTLVQNPTGSPKAQGWYYIVQRASISGDTSKYELSSDTEVQYVSSDKVTYVETTDTTVKSGKKYYKNEKGTIVNSMMAGYAESNPAALGWYEKSSGKQAKDYYIRHSLKFTEVSNPEGQNPSQNGWYEWNGVRFVKSSDTEASGYYYSTSSSVASDTSGDNDPKKGSGKATSETAMENRVKLFNEAKDYIKHAYMVDSFSMDVTAVDLYMLDSTASPIHLGDLVKVITDNDGNYIVAVCTAIKYDLVNPEKTKYTIGDLTRIVV